MVIDFSFFLNSIFETKKTQKNAINKKVDKVKLIKKYINYQ